MTLSRAVAAAAQAVYGVVGFFDCSGEVLILLKPGTGNEKRQADGAAAEFQYISSSVLFRAGEKLPLHRERLVVENPLFDAAPEGKGDCDLVSWRLAEDIRQLDLGIRHDLWTGFAFLNPHIHGKTPVHLTLGKYGLQPDFFILHFVRQLTAESQLHEILADIDG